MRRKKKVNPLAAMADMTQGGMPSGIPPAKKHKSKPAVAGAKGNFGARMAAARAAKKKKPGAKGFFSG